MKSGNLKFLEPSGPLQACNATDLFYVIYMYVYCCEHSYTVSCTLACRIEILWRFTCKPNSVAVNVYFLFACVYSRGTCSCFLTKPVFAAGSCLTSRPTLKLKDHPLSVVRDCLFNIFAATLHIEGRSSIRNLRTPHAVVKGTHFWWGNLREKKTTWETQA